QGGWIFHLEETEVRVGTGRRKVRCQFAVDCRGGIQAAQIQLEIAVRRASFLKPKRQTVKSRPRRLRPACSPGCKKPTADEESDEPCHARILELRCGEFIDFFP